MKNRGIIIIGCGFHSMAEIAKIAAMHINDFAVVYKEVSTSKNYKGNPFDKPQIKITPLKEIAENIKKLNKNSISFDEPKSKYINKPIRNYRR